ncbi:MAG: STAS-like domain-containing protein [Candidatus Thermoplasmatota archaeon]|nr:STAS-like domain-containing protein [Candidatus Thermoplasmatota archaeon]
MKEILLEPLVGAFAENKDKAREIRLEQIIPNIESGNEIILDFEGIDSATQSFIHALISDPIRKYGDEVLDKILFKNCTNEVKKVIEIVVDYMRESLS